MKVMLVVTNNTTIVSLVPFPHAAIFTTLFGILFIRCPTLQTIMKWPVKNAEAIEMVMTS
jgi:hypothetical protein